MYQLKCLENGFKYIEVHNEVCSAKIALQGAHIFEYTKNNSANLLWLSEASAFEDGIAIRGGIPICWPRFGSLDTTMPQHGFARTQEFKLVSLKETNNTVELKLVLSDTKKSREVWNHKFELEVTIILSESLNISLKTTNLDKEEFMITQALHTYFSVSSIKNIHIKGLEDEEYYDALLNSTNKESKSIVINREIDRVYQHKNREIILYDGKKIILLKTQGSESTIVWNPWIKKCSTMSNMQKNDYKSFVCIESANAFDDFKLIKSSQNHTLSLTVSF